MLAVGEGDERALLLPRSDSAPEDRAGDFDAAISLADVAGWRCTATELAFEGGDLLFGWKRAFVGLGTISSNTDFDDRNDVVAAFERLLGLEVVVVGTETPPHGHLDMYLTVLDDDRVVLGDPVAGRELLNLGDEPSAVPLPAFDRWTAEAQCAMEPEYEKVRQQLVRSGIEVLRIPIVHGEEGGLLTWNNCLVERRRGIRRVYMPVYGVPDLDEAAVAVFRAAGYRVFPIDCAAIVKDGGTVRCITNVVAWSCARPGGPAQASRLAAEAAPKGDF